MRALNQLVEKVFNNFARSAKLSKKFASLSRLRGRGAEPPPPSADGGTPNAFRSSAGGEFTPQA